MIWVSVTPMPDLPQRHSLASQMADILRDGMQRGLWRDRLPGERALCEKYQVSRNTVRAALRQLQQEKLVQAVHGSGNHIVGRPGKAARFLQSRDVGLLSPEPLERLRPTQTLWIDELRAMLSERGCRLHVFHGRQYFRANPGPALQRLVAENPHGCWILTLSNAAIQRWFARSEVKCVVAGSVHAGLDLPYRDLDHRAMCRHAAGMLLGLGHRRLGLVAARSQLAGDFESEAGFTEGVQKSPQSGAEVFVCRHDGTVGGICRALRWLMQPGRRPTALLVVNPFHFITVSSRLGQMGLRIPEDVSLVSRDDDSFLSFLQPEPARYVAGAQSFARGLLRPVLELLQGHQPSDRAARVTPQFIRGESLARMGTGGGTVVFP
jgi:DNA-binding LacI/PurR family transcriptional regulator